MNEIKNKLITGYVILPILLLAFSLGTISLLINAPSEKVQNDEINGRAFQRLIAKPVSLLTPYPSTSEYYDEMNSVKAVWDEYNDDYLNRLNIEVAFSSAATLSKLQECISITERIHITSHGWWSTIAGPNINMWGTDLTQASVTLWSLSTGLAKAIYLSACCGMGANGVLDTRLANEIQQRTSIVSVIGFKDSITILAATLISQKFWKYHTALHSTGGISTDASYYNAKIDLSQDIQTLSLMSSVAIGILVADLAALASSGAGVIFASALLTTISSWLLFEAALGHIEDALDNWEIIGDSVPGFSWGDVPSGGGGGPKDTMD